jgi:hypothetical protein
MSSCQKILIGLVALVLLGITGAVTAINYTVYTPIEPISILMPNNYILVVAGSQLPCECTLPHDYDCSDAGGTWHTISDTVTITWSGAGTFTPQTGTSVTWTAPAGTGPVTITATANDSPLADDGARSTSRTLYVISVSSVRVYTSSAYNDNSGAGLNDHQVHFGEGSGTGAYAYPNVYLEITLTAANPSVVDHVTLRTTSESDATGINVAFTETGANTNVYRCDAPIHLDTYSSEGGRRLRVVDEEHLAVAGRAGPEVDRAEVATMTADVGWWIQGITDQGADALDQFLDRSEGPDPDPYFWWDNGEVRATTSRDTFATFVKSVGNTNSEADFLFQCSHGGEGNVGYIGGAYGLFKPGSGTPTIVSTDWDADLEWAVFYSCDVFGYNRYSQPSAFIGYWDDALIRGANVPYAHGICGSSDLLWVAPILAHMQEFCERMQGNANTVRSAYMDSATDISLPMMQENAANLFRNSNINDYLNNVTADATDTQVAYTYIAGSEGYGDYYGTDLPTPQNLQAAAIVRSGHDVVCAIPTDRPLLTKVLVRKATPIPSAALTADARNFKQDRAGRFQFRKTPRLSGPIQLSRQQGAAAAAGFVAQNAGGIPADAELTRTLVQTVLTYNAARPAKTQKQYVEKALLEYGHKINGIPVAGGNRGDSILVILAGDEVAGVNYLWRSFEKNIGKPVMVIAAQDALATAVANIPRVIPDAEEKGYSITEIGLFYYGRPSATPTDILVPAWGFQINKSLRVFVDALTGEYLE